MRNQEKSNENREYKYIVYVQFEGSKKAYTFGSNLSYKQGDPVVVETVRGKELGQVCLDSQPFDPDEVKGSIKPVIRLATEYDVMQKKDNVEKAEEAMKICHQCIADLGLDMHLISGEYTLDRSKVIFTYVSDERVDFRQLIKVLAEEFKVRIEMKQIGARQEAGRIGGIGPCGRPLCCSSWMTNFVSVATSAARFQDISLNPQKLAGQCAKLKCCMNFEVDCYAEIVKKLPPKDAKLETKDHTYYHFKTDILKREMTYSTDKSTPTNLVTISVERVFEIIALNKNGVKPEKLALDSKERESERKAFGDIIEQADVTRFDKAKRKKNKSGKKQQNKPQGNGNQGNHQQAEANKDGQPNKPQQKNKQQQADGGNAKPQRRQQQDGGNARNDQQRNNNGGGNNGNGGGNNNRRNRPPRRNGGNNGNGNGGNDNPKPQQPKPQQQPPQGQQ